jgi:hypothetical protein
MFRGPLPNGFAAPRAAIEKNTATKAACLESPAREAALPGFNTRKKDSSTATLSTANGTAGRKIVRESWPNN